MIVATIGRFDNVINAWICGPNIDRHYIVPNTRQHRRQIIRQCRH